MSAARRRPPVVVDPRDVVTPERRALELWNRIHHLTADERAEVETMSDPYRSAFVANDLRGAGRHTDALLIASAAIPTTDNPSVWRSHLYRIQAGVLAELRLVQQAVEANELAQHNARAVGDDAALATCLIDLALYPHNENDRARRDALLSEAREIAVGCGAEEVVLLADFDLAWWHVEHGTTTPAVLRELEQVETRARSLWPDLADEVRAARVVTAATAGDLGTARTLAQGLADDATTEDERTRTALARARAWLLADEGKVEEAQQTLVALLDEVSEDMRCDLLDTLTEVLGHAGRYADAWQTSRDLLTLTRDSATTLGGAQARALEVWSRTQHAERALQREHEHGDELERALARLSAAHEQIREMSQRDLLTGLHNRAHLLHAGAVAIAAARPEAPIVVALVDIDGFASVNDRYGHRAGDAVLAGFGRVARQVLDAEDVVARYGGEEFVVIRPAGVRPGRTLRADLTEIAARCRGLAFPDEDGNGPVGMSMSGGVVVAVGGPLETALQLADLRMYAAKRAGGNRFAGDDA